MALEGTVLQHKDYCTSSDSIVSDDFSISGNKDNLHQESRGNMLKLGYDHVEIFGNLIRKLEAWTSLVVS